MSNKSHDFQTAEPEPLKTFTPTSLTDGQWLIARPIVLAAVRSIPNLPSKQHKPYASRLCRFLAASTWDRTGTPDLHALLTERAIGSLVSAEQMPGVSAAARGTYRRMLRRIGRATGSIPTANPAPPRTPTGAARAFWLGVAGTPVSFVAAADAYARGGYQAHPGMWTGFGHELKFDGDLSVLTRSGCVQPVSVSCVAGEATGTVIDVRRAARDLRSADNIDLRVVSPIAPSPLASVPTNRATGPSKPTSRTARARQARAAIKRAETAAEAPVAVAVADLPPLSDEVEAAIVSYRPDLLDTHTWTDIGDAVVHALRAYNPPNARWVSSQAGHVTSFVTWAVRCSRASGATTFTIDLLVVPGLVDRYLEEALVGRPDSSRATVRSILRRVVRNLTGEAAERIKYVPIQAPYTPTECAAFVRLARNQPTKNLRRALSAVVALGLGAGLDGGDQREVTPADITDVELDDGVTGLLVKVKGQRPRTVVMRAEYELLLREALNLHNTSRRGKNTPIYGLSTSRRNVTSTVTSKAITATGTGVDINAARLRATWLLACMNSPVPLAVLLNAAGLKTARTFTDLLAYCPPADQTQIAAVLRTVEAHTAGGGEFR